MCKTVAIFIPTLKKGGAEKQAILLANAMADEHKVFFVLFNPELGIEEEFLKLINDNNVGLIKLQGTLAAKLKQFYKILKRKKIEVLFCYLTRPNFFGSIVGKFAGVKLVFQGIRSSFLPWNKIIEEKISGWFSNGIIVNCYSGKIILENKGLRKITVIPNCHVNPKLAISREDRKLVRIISVGRFTAPKDYRTALEAVAMLKKNFIDFKYIIVGYGELESEIKSWVKELGLFEMTKILINPKNILSLLDESDIYLSTSLYEGTSNSIMEALDSSLPIVATNVGDNYVMIEEGQNGFLTKVGDVKALAASLLKLARSYELRNKMGKRSNEILREKYSLERFKESYLKLVQ